METYKGYTLQHASEYVGVGLVAWQVGHHEQHFFEFNVIHSYFYFIDLHDVEWCVKTHGYVPDLNVRYEDVLIIFDAIRGIVYAVFKTYEDMAMAMLKYTELFEHYEPKLLHEVMK